MRRPAYETARPDVERPVPATPPRGQDHGCAAGARGAARKARGPVEVVGVEADAAYAAEAAERLDRVVHADLETLDPDGLGPFDCLVAADVLEHLRDPWGVLRRFAGLVAPGGTVVVSLPNVRSWETFWQLGRHGRWPRRSVGLFDATHLRWFTLADAHDLLAQAGVTVTAAERRLLRPDGTPWPAAVERVAARAPGARTLLTLQHVLSGHR